MSFLGALKTTGVNGEPIELPITDMKLDIVGGWMTHLEKENKRLQGKLEVLEGMYEELQEQKECVDKDLNRMRMKLYAWSKDEEIQKHKARADRLSNALLIYSKKRNWWRDKNGHNCVFNADTNGPYIALRALREGDDESNT